VPEKNDTALGEPTSPYLPTFDTGGFTPTPAMTERVLTLDPPQRPETPHPPEPVVVPAHPVVAAGAYQFLKRWVFALLTAGVWVVAAAIGAGLYDWWIDDLDPNKTWPVFGVLVYLVICMVAAVVVSTVSHKPMVSAMAIALMSAPLASTAGAAALYGAYVFGWIAR
jgi:hypothetical protein